MRKTHMEQIDEWADFVRNNPGGWKEMHTDFINSIFENHRRVYRKLVKTRQGKKKILQIYKIRNIDGFPDLK